MTLKLKSHDHQVSTRRTTVDRPLRAEDELMAITERLLRRPHPPKEPVRLLGISVSSLAEEEGAGGQLEFDFRP